jgi:hypothetical protein
MALSAPNPPILVPSGVPKQNYYPSARFFRLFDACTPDTDNLTREIFCATDFYGEEISMFIFDEEGGPGPAVRFVEPEFPSFTPPLPSENVGEEIKAAIKAAKAEALERNGLIHAARAMRGVDIVKGDTNTEEVVDAEGSGNTLVSEESDTTEVESSADESKDVERVCSCQHPVAEKIPG